ncbi:MAG: HisA/HisF-related TIM barrel protein [Mangrovibacterium sp.]
MGDPAELAIKYPHEEADECVFLNITTTHENRKEFVVLLKRNARKTNISFAVEGGVLGFMMVLC